jgi:hypothetical protein
MKAGEPVTVSINKNNFNATVSVPFARELEIVKVNNHPVFGRCWNLVTKYEDRGNGQHTISMRKLNTSRWWIIREIQLWSIRKLLNNGK